MPRSPTARLAEAVLSLERRLEEIEHEAVGLSNEIIKAVDRLARELVARLEEEAEKLVREAEEAAAREAERLRSEYAEREREELERVRLLAERNRERAVRAVAEELKRIAGGLGLG